MRDVPIRTIVARPFTTVRQWSEHVPTDLLGVAGFTVVAATLLAVGDLESPFVRVAIGFPLLFLAPGYATVSALFPRSSPLEAGETAVVQQTRDVSDVERAALSFGMSVALIPLLGLAIAATPWGFTQRTVVGAVGCFVLVGVALASVRRLRVPPSDRYQIDVSGRIAAVRAAILETDSSAQTTVNVILALSMVLALTTVGYALAAPQEGERYTSLQLLTEDDSGEFVASGYPSSIEPGESIPLVVALENDENRERSYTVVIQEQRLEDGEIVERTELQRLEYTLGDGETVRDERNVTPTAEDGTVRISVLLYADGVPETPTNENAYRHAYLWTDVLEESDVESEEAVGSDDDDGAEEEDDEESEGDEDEDEDEDDEDEDDEDDE